MERDGKEASLTIDDLRSRLLSRSGDEGPEAPLEEKAPDEKRVLSREFKQYVVACICGVVVALLVISFMG